ncbi:hypothetical protein [Bacillus sp. es.034]|uniref:hypothetical protein n=1 Tax=Bacillus sp. es.034 TaxID=1761763 RepID=UPI000C00ED5E|nr:hypothetical protein [Bacillus sp. es.034]PFG05292.1 hypothetical protein ATG71_2121 [Bacillus sp. es.034]
MATFFITLMGIFMVMANVYGFITYKKKKNLFSAAFSIFLLAIVFGGIGGAVGTGYYS